MRNQDDKLRLDGRKVRSLRREHGLSQESLGEKTGVDLRTIQRVEKGLPVRPETLGLLAEALEVETVDLVAHSPVGPPAAGSDFPYAFDSLIADRIQGFVGRKFVTDSLDEFLRTQESGYFLIEAKPGMGKSALLAHLVVERDYTMHHFNSSGLGIVSPRQFLENLTTRLSAAFDMTVPEVPSSLDQHGAFLVRVLTQASRSLEDGARMVVVVDALDEADMSGVSGTHNSLFLPSVLPTGVFVVASTRDAGSTLAHFARRELFVLTPEDPNNCHDVVEYLAGWAERPEMRSQLKSMKVSVTRFVDIMAAKSRANFMYLRYMLPDVERGAFRTLDDDTIPDGLEAYYEDHWRRMGMGVGSRSEIKLRALYVLASLNRPVPRDLFAHLSGLSSLQAQDVLEDWRPFLASSIQDGVSCFSLYHASFREFLHRKEVLQAAGIDLQNLDKSIADIMKKDLLG